MSCKSTQNNEKNIALNAYNRGLFSTAEYEAIKAGNASENRYLAGLSTFNRKKYKSAKKHFKASLKGNNSTISSNSKVMLGQIAVIEKNWPEAAGYFSDAWDTLKGNDKIRAASWASKSFEQSNNYIISNLWKKRSTHSFDLNLSTNYYVQLGVYKNQKNASIASKNITKVLQKEGYLKAKVSKRLTHTGITEWIVRSGPYPNRSTAKSVAVASKIAGAYPLPASIIE